MFTVTGCSGYVMVEVTPVPPTVTATARIDLVTATPRATATAAPATPLPTFTATPTPTPVIHVIQSGETLLDLSYQYGVSVQALIEANGIENPRALSIGQALIIPHGEASSWEQPPTPTPTPMPLRVVNVAFHQTPAGSLWCMGEVKNERDEILEFVQVQVSLHNADGEMVELGVVFAASEIVPAQGVAPFALLLPDVPPGSWASYQIVVRSAEPLTHWGERYGDLAVQDLHGEMRGDLFHVKGVVFNNGEVTARRIRLVFTMYGVAGEVVGVRRTEMAAVLRPGEREAFEFDLIPQSPADALGVIVLGSSSER